MKEAGKLLSFLVQSVQKIHFVATSHQRLTPLHSIIKAAKEFEQDHTGQTDQIFQELVADGDIGETIRKALQESVEDEVMLVCGTFYIMEDVKDFF